MAKINLTDGFDHEKIAQSQENLSAERSIDLLSQVGFIFLVLAVISLFVCTLPVWLIVLIVVLLLC
jgi:hypothetical protein